MTFDDDIEVLITPRSTEDWQPSKPRRSPASVNQRAAILRALQAGHRVDRDACLNRGLPGCDRILRLAARIRELRKMGYLIRTNWDPVGNTCSYVLDFSS